jgi:hypothetical protein
VVLICISFICLIFLSAVIAFRVPPCQPNMNLSLAILQVRVRHRAVWTNMSSGLCSFLNALEETIFLIISSC